MLFSSYIDKTPNAFTSTSFKRHYNTIVDEPNTKKSSDIFYHKPSTADTKELIDQYKDNVFLNPSDCVYENFKNFSPQKMSFTLNI